MSIDPSEPTDVDVVSLHQRVEALERENQRLRERLEPLVGTVLAPDNPNFHPREFLKALRRALLVVMLPIYLIAPLALLAPFVAPKLASARIGPVRVVDFAGVGTRHPGFGFGLLAFGGLAFGGVAGGGLAVGAIALGGGAVGIVAVGGGSVGVIAVGGGAVGWIALGGGAVGYYAMGQTAHGKYALGMNRQDPEAVEFFQRYVPGLRRAVTNPMPVLPLPRERR